MATTPTDAQRKANRRLAWALASAALVFGLGFIAKIVLLGR
ncbi:cytochrome oxidase small assembly protein [Pseudaquabacterium terrae]|nr:cytochrome oxidase small assembly protein [Aquabacterium terrae]